MKIHHLNCGTMHPFGLPAKDGKGSPLKRGYGVVHCLLIDTGSELALVDTGWGIRDCTNPSPATRQFMGVVGAPGDVNETAIKQVEELGYKPPDVKHIFMTHMHLDHAGGLPDFPDAAIHVFTDELDACQHPRTLVEWRAYRPEHWAHGPKWQLHTLEGYQWFGLDCVSPIQIGEMEFVMIPFTGHTRGHCAIGLQMGNRWLLHCGDVYGYYGQVDTVQPYQHPCGSLIETLVTTGFNMPRHHWLLIRKLLQAHGEQIRTLCSHDNHEFELFSKESRQLHVRS